MPPDRKKQTETRRPDPYKQKETRRTREQAVRRSKGMQLQIAAQVFAKAAQSDFSPILGAVTLHQLKPCIKKQPFLRDEAAIRAADRGDDVYWGAGQHIGYCGGRNEAPQIKFMVTISQSKKRNSKPQWDIHQYEPTEIEAPAPEKWLIALFEQLYDKFISPHIHTVGRVPAFSERVYGELKPTFLQRIISGLKLGPESVFFDLGCAVGNACMMASALSGCTSYGVEIEPEPANIATHAARWMQKTCASKDVQCGHIEIECADMRDSVLVRKHLSKTTALLFNNEIFRGPLNEFARNLCLELPDGAIVVTLQPLGRRLHVDKKPRITPHDMNGVESILRMTSKPYSGDDVSWKSSGGRYFIHVVDRSGLETQLKKLKVVNF
uniref:Histone-lysine N-methyltransferase, H3 lysine-79 specific n=1 Tax=Mycena chlorophos TaxID=658473 RepID=A0ABQ0KUW2_MYCCL|nr:predicted protein [Mycena chlorophos]